MIRIASRRGSPRPTVATILAVLLLGAGLSFAGDAGPAVHEGQSLVEAIDALRSLGVSVIYSTNLVRPGMLVREDPAPGLPLDVLHEVLGAHGLTTEPGPGGARLVVKASPTGTIRGVVRREGAVRLPAARVSVSGGAPSAVTDRRGRFELEVPAGDHTLVVEANGFLARRVAEVTVDPDHVTEVIVEMSSEIAIRESVVVTPTRPDVGVSISGEQLEGIPALANDAIRAAARLAGAAESDLSAGINVRGGRSDELMIVVDGLEIHEPFHVRDLGGGMLGLIDADDIGEVDFFRGGFPVKYGNRMSGVMDISLATPARGSRTTIGVESGQERLSSRGRFAADSGSWLVSARAGSPEYTLPDWIPEAEYDPDYYDVLGRIEYQPSDKLILAGNVLLGLDEVRAPGLFGSSSLGEDSAIVDTTYGNRYAWLTIESSWRARLTARTVVAQGQVDRDRRVRLGDAPAISDDRDFEFFGVLQDWSYDGGRHRLRWGAGLRQQRADYDYFVPGPGAVGLTDVHAGPSGSESSAYVSDAIRLGRSLEVEIGVRWDDETYTGFDDNSIDPRLNLVYTVTERTAVRLGWGRFHQAQRIHELQVEDGIDGFFPSESSDQTVVALDHDFLHDWSLRLGAYYKRIADPRLRFENLFDPTGFLPESQADRVAVDADRAVLKGVELEIRGGAGSRFGWSAAYVLSSAADEIGGRLEPRAWDQRHAADVTLLWDLDGRWRFSLAGTYHSGWPTTAVTAELVDDEIVTTLGTRNGQRLPSYRRVDVGVRRSFEFGRHGLSLHVNVINALDRDNTCCVEGFDFVAGAGGVEVLRRTKSSLSRTAAFGATWRF